MASDETNEPERLDHGLSTIPKLFESIEADGPFTTCIECERDLRPHAQQYLIEKGIRGRETVYEYALCLGCVLGMRARFSEESKRDLDAFFDGRADIEARGLELLATVGPEAGAWIEDCVFCRRPREECPEYQMYAWCSGALVLYSILPYFVCGQCIDLIGEVLSTKTIGDIEDWSDEFLSPPPHLLELLVDTPLKRF